MMAKSKKYMEALKQYRQLAKKADQRLVRLEKLAQEENFKGVKQFAYARAQRDIRAWSGENARRFNTSPPRTLQSLKAKIADIQNFLDSKTSTRRDIITYYEKRNKTVQDRYGITGSWQQMANYYRRGINKRFDAKYGSKTALRAIGMIQQNKKQIQEDMRKKKHVDLQLDDDVLNDAVEDMLQYHRKALRQAGIL
jgi:hypothetical protein